MFKVTGEKNVTLSAENEEAILGKPFPATSL